MTKQQQKRLETGVTGPSPCQRVVGVCVQSVIEDLDALLAHVEHQWQSSRDLHLVDAVSRDLEEEVAGPEVVMLSSCYITILPHRD